MPDYRISMIAGVVTSTAVVNVGGDPAAAALTASNANYAYRSIWGIMTDSSAVGHVSFSGGGAIALADLATGVPIPCRPTQVSASAGKVYLLAGG